MNVKGERSRNRGIVERRDARRFGPERKPWGIPRRKGVVTV